MYVIIKSDKAEHLKEKLHHIKTAAMEVLECIEVARHTDHAPEDYTADHSRHAGYDMERSRGRRGYDDYDDYEREMSRGRRGRY